MVTARRRATLETDGNGNPIQGALHPAQTIAIPYTATAGINAGADPIIAQVVRIRSTTACFVKFSSSGVLAVVTDMYLPANTPEMYALSQDHYISAIRESVSGTLYVTIMD